MLFLFPVSDTSNAALTVPWYIAAYMDESILHVAWICDLSTVVSIFFACTTIYAIAAISVCRYKVVSDPYSSLNGVRYNIICQV